MTYTWTVLSISTANQDNLQNESYSFCKIGLNKVAKNSAFGYTASYETFYFDSGLQ